MKKEPKKNKKRIAGSIEFVATNGPMTVDLMKIPNKTPGDQFDISETETEIAITLRYVVLHATKARGDTSVARNIEKSMRNGKPVQAYADGAVLSDMDSNGQSMIELPLGPIKEVQERAKAQGKTFRLCTPKEGIPVFLGNDWNEEYNALQKKKRR